MALWLVLYAGYAATLGMEAVGGLEYAGHEPHHLLVAESLANDGLLAHPKTSGSKGMQAYVALDADAPVEEVHGYARRLAERLEKAYPKLIVSKMDKSVRRKKVLIDWSQNNRAKTTVAPYSLRARRCPTVSCPVTWEEVSNAAESEDGSDLVFESDAVLDRIERHGDLFAPVLELKQKVPKV